MKLSINEIKQMGNNRKRSAAILSWFEDALLIETDDCIVWPFGSSLNYGTLVIDRENKSVHVETYKRKIGTIPGGKEIAHGPCHNRLCFNYKHLSAKTSKENHADRLRDGTSQNGEANSNTKLSSRDVSEIKRLYTY